MNNIIGYIIDEIIVGSQGTLRDFLSWFVIFFYGLSENHISRIDGTSSPKTFRKWGCVFSIYMTFNLTYQVIFNISTSSTFYLYMKFPTISPLNLSHRGTPIRKPFQVYDGVARSLVRLQIMPHMLFSSYLYRHCSSSSIT